jgi:hypothetical protein
LLSDRLNSAKTVSRGTKPWNATKSERPRPIATARIFSKRGRR